MPVTRAANYPVEAANLMAAFNRCADGHDAKTVIEAAAQMFAAALHNYGRMAEWPRERTVELAQDACQMVMEIVADNIGRQPQPDDVRVEAQ